MTPPAPDKIATALTVLQSLGVSAEDLKGLSTRPPVPTFAEYIPRVYASLPATLTRDAYLGYWRRLLELDGWADRRLDEVTVTDLQLAIELLQTQRKVRRNDRNGYSVRIHAVVALRRLYQSAVDDRLIDATDNPAQRLRLPRQQPSTRDKIPDEILRQMYDIAATTGQDPELDLLLLRLHTETACRPIGAMSLRRIDLDTTQCLIRLREKGNTERWQPVSPSLMDALLRHAADRPVAPDEPLLRSKRGGRPVRRRRYENMFVRMSRYIPDITVRGISIYWLRHTTLKWVERNFGLSVAKAYAGHADSHRDGATTIYTRASTSEVAEALSWLTGEQHPLAPSADYGSQPNE
ncbi:site-specific integrase [Nocardia vinacea]|uniref:tyrosine-type recombinase/integrase n=1 Tax=Nocardia vinacea TaxID=96468 RepID=UPI002E105AF8|nr:site-specific integrase [Nocardia vinacea]